MLDKYDEEEDTGMEIDESGAFNSDKAKQQAEIRARLAAGLSAARVLFFLPSSQLERTSKHCCIHPVQER